MAINFPASPNVNDTFTEGSITYKCLQNEPTKWIGLGLTPSDRLVEGSNNLEINSSNNLVWTGGNVGIGVSDPDSILETLSSATDGINAHIGGIYNDGGQSAVRRIEFGVKNYRNYIQSQQGSGGNNFTSDNSLLLNPSGGNVGIGSTNPSQPLTLKRSSSGQAEFGYRLEFEDTDGPTQTSSALLVGTYGLKLKNYNSGRNFLFETGNVLMGGLTTQETSVDSSKLAIQGGDTNIGIIQVHSGGGETAGDLAGIAFSHGADNATARAKCAIASRCIGAYGKGHLCFYVDGANDNAQVSDADEKMRISTDGSVTKPSNALIKTSGSTNFGAAGSLTTNTANTGILQASASINKGNTGWTESGSNAYTFVCPVDGIYVVHAHVSYGNIGGGRKIWVMSYTLGGGDLPLSSYVEVMDHTSQDYANFSYYDTYEFTAGTRVGMGRNGGSGTIAGQTFQWGIHLLQ